MFVLGGSSSQLLARKISFILGEEFLPVEIGRFPDGELYVRILGDPTGDDVVVVNSTSFPQNDRIVEILFILDALSEFRIGEITLVVPYFGYGRQDKVFKKGEPVSARALAKAFSQRIDRFLTVDIHAEHILDYFDVEARNLTAMREIGRYFSKILEKPSKVIAPDDGAIERARLAAEELGVDYDYIEKVRLGPGEVVMNESKDLGVLGKSVLIVDDMIDSGGTLVEATRLLLKQGAREVYAGCTHAVLSGGALSKILSSGVKEVVATDTIPREISKISVAGLIAEALRK